MLQDFAGSFDSSLQRGGTLEDRTLAEGRVGWVGSTRVVVGEDCDNPSMDDVPVADENMVGTHPFLVMAFAGSEKVDREVKQRRINNKEHQARLTMGCGVCPGGCK